MTSQYFEISTGNGSSNFEKTQLQVPSNVLAQGSGYSNIKTLAGFSMANTKAFQPSTELQLLEQEALTSLQGQVHDFLVASSHLQPPDPQTPLDFNPSSLQHFVDEPIIFQRLGDCEVLANAGMGLIGPTTDKTRQTSPLLYPSTSKRNIVQISRNSSIAGFDIHDLLQNQEQDETAYLPKMRQIQEGKEDKKHQKNEFAPHERSILLLKQQQKKVQENLRHEQLLSLVRQRQLEEQERELQLRMVTIETLQQIQSTKCETSMENFVAKSHGNPMNEDCRESKNIVSENIVKVITLQKPKRALSAYNVFFHEERRRLMQEMATNSCEGQDDVSSTTSKQSDGLKGNPDCLEEVHVKKRKRGERFEYLGKTIGQRWKTVSSDQEKLKYYQDIAKKDKKRYEAEMAAWRQKQRVLVRERMQLM